MTSIGYLDALHLTSGDLVPILAIGGLAIIVFLRYVLTSSSPSRAPRPSRVKPSPTRSASVDTKDKKKSGTPPAKSSSASSSPQDTSSTNPSQNRAGPRLDPDPTYSRGAHATSTPKKQYPLRLNTRTAKSTDPKSTATTARVREHSTENHWRYREHEASTSVERRQASKKQRPPVKPPKSHVKAVEFNQSSKLVDVDDTFSFIDVDAGTSLISADPIPDAVSVNLTPTPINLQPIRSPIQIDVPSLAKRALFPSTDPTRTAPQSTGRNQSETKTRREKGRRPSTRHSRRKQGPTKQQRRGTTERRAASPRGRNRLDSLERREQEILDRADSVTSELQRRNQISTTHRSGNSHREEPVSAGWMTSTDSEMSPFDPRYESPLLNDWENSVSERLLGKCDRKQVELGSNYEYTPPVWDSSVVQLPEIGFRTRSGSESGRSRQRSSGFSIDPFNLCAGSTAENRFSTSGAQFNSPQLPQLRKPSEKEVRDLFGVQEMIESVEKSCDSGSFGIDWESDSSLPGYNNEDLDSVDPDNWLRF